MPTKKKKIIKKRKKKIHLTTSLLSMREAQRSRCGVIITGSSRGTSKKSSIPHKTSQKIKNHEKIVIKRKFKFPQFNFANNTAIMNANKPKKSYQPENYTSGLLPKEKAYLICTCQTKSTRYVVLKALAATAIKHNKIFSIYGSCNAVRKALLERGWVEKIPPDRMNLSKLRSGAFTSKTAIHCELEKLLLSNFVEKSAPNFVWRTKDDLRLTTIDMNRDCGTMVNKLRTEALWTTKQGLCSSMKSHYWFYIEDVAEVNGPRSYNSYDSGEIDEFVKDYKLTACTSLLKWILSMIANDRHVFVETGKVSMNVVIFALNRCKEYLFRKQNKDIDRTITSVSPGQWNAFLKKYYLIIAKDEVFQADTENKLPLYTSYAKFLLKEIHKYRPQVSCEGCHNIWIIKPGHNSRGRGIRMASKLGVITNLLNKVHAKYVIQKYIEEPLLIHDTKFDIRQYYLVTSTYPLVIWMYRDCYLKFSSQKYSLKNYHESIHLTNNAVQRKYTNCSGRHPDLPASNMWDSDKYKEYLNRIGKDQVWDNIIYPGMRKSIIGTMLSCQDSLSVSKNRFELYGCDFILDKEYKPWLIEINSCPDLNHTTLVTAKICPAVVSDIIKVVIDYPNDPKAPTGKFECIYRQPMTIPRFGLAADLYIRGYALPNDYFYKGKIQIKESFDETDIGKERNIQAVLNRLKHRYDTDAIMIEPEENEENIPKEKKDKEIDNTESEFEISAVATVITEQLDELMDRVASEHSFCSNRPKQVPQTRSPIQNSESEINIKALVKKSLSRFSSTEAIGIQQSFKFSHLDDGPLGKGSFIDFASLKNIFNDFTNLNDNLNETCTCQDHNILLATAKMINFINKKQKEFRHDMRCRHF